MRHHVRKPENTRLNAALANIALNHSRTSLRVDAGDDTVGHGAAEAACVRCRHPAASTYPNGTDR